jgi:hypothetical protein
MLSIQKRFIKYNYSTGNTIKYIVIHDTANKAKGADAEAHYRYFNGGDRGASAHYFVDDHSIVQLVADKNAAWHVGDGKGKYGITNHNSIGIEICINSDGNYEQAVANAVELTRYLMQKYNIPLERVVRHYDASRKNCPGSMSANNWARWYQFKEQLKGDIFEMDYGIVIGSFADFPAVEPLAMKLQAPVFLAKALQEVNKCKTIIVCGADNKIVKSMAGSSNIINLSGADRYETYANIANYLKGVK